MWAVCAGNAWAGVSLEGLCGVCGVRVWFQMRRRGADAMRFVGVYVY